MSTPLARIRDNWTVVTRPRAQAPAFPPVAPRRVLLLVLAGLALILFVGVLYDGRLITATRALPEPVHAFFSWLTRFGQSDWLLIPSGLVALIVALGDWQAVSRRNAAAWREIGTFAAVFFTAIALTGIAADVIKPIVGRFRPDFVSGAHFAPFEFGGYGNYSFPSGHATTMATVAIVAAFVWGRWTVPIMVGAVLVAISRVVIAVHFPSDVVGGALLGLGLGTLYLRRATNAGLAFVMRPNGRIDRRFGVTAALSRRHELAALLPALWIALRPRPRPARLPDPQ